MKDFSFTLFNSKWSVSFVDGIEVETEGEGLFKFGESDPATNRILVATKDNEGNDLPKSTVKLTLLHEMVHAMFSTGQYNQTNEDEPLVEWLANCIYTLLEQHKL